MDESKQTDALIDAVGDVPVILRVEIGAAQMRARGWAASGVEIARGELVGEVAVRIVERVDGRGARS
jgi:hypothetical protein